MAPRPPSDRQDPRKAVATHNRTPLPTLQTCPYPEDNTLLRIRYKNAT